mgnify:CR=1 FL=1
MELGSDDSSFEEEEFGKSPQGQENEQGEEVKDMHYDEVYELDDSEEEDVPSNPEDNPPGAMRESFSQGSEFSQPSQDMGMNPAAFQNQNFAKEFDGSESEGEEEPQIQGAYNPADYQNLPVSGEIKELFQYIQRYKSQHIDLETKLKPFIPDYIPAVGEVDAFLKIPRPDASEEELGLTVLDEPKLNQSDPALLELQLKPLLKRPGTGGSGAAVRSIENADKNPKQITRWVNSIADVHRTKPLPTVNYSKPMPDIDTLMDVWHPQVEELLNNIELPSPDIDIDLAGYVRLVCAILDIPVHNLPNNKSMIESLHLLFTLYSDFKSNQHFRLQEQYAYE